MRLPGEDDPGKFRGDDEAAAATTDPAKRVSLDTLCDM